MEEEVGKLSMWSTLKIVRKSLKNWVSVSTFLRDSGKVREVNLEFRDGSRLDSVTDSKVAMAIIRYYYYATLLGSYSPSDTVVLNRLGNDITARIGRVYSDREIQESLTGGWFGRKEALLFALIRKHKPSLIVETGVAQGVSTYVILTAIERNETGELLSIDLPNRNPNGRIMSDGSMQLEYVKEDLDTGWLVPTSLRGHWSLREGKSTEVLPTIGRLPDMFFHDSEHSYANMTFEFEWAHQRLPVGGVLVSDDVLCNKAFSDFLERHQNMRNLFPETEVGIAVKM